MILPAVLKTFSILLFFHFSLLLNAQETLSGKTDIQKPYKILTNGKQISIQSKQYIKSVLVWTASGHRIVEQKKINALSFSFTITVNEKIFFILVEMTDGNRYTSKLGVN
ncbi:MAG TPA: hypothetical protein VI548_14555 [Chitinophagaceae bacterium]|nr:hypothetical protein [Chitinophagaceae bacterium]